MEQAPQATASGAMRVSRRFCAAITVSRIHTGLQARQPGTQKLCTIWSSQLEDFKSRITRSSSPLDCAFSPSTSVFAAYGCAPISSDSDLCKDGRATMNKGEEQEKACCVCMLCAKDSHRDARELRQAFPNTYAPKHTIHRSRLGGGEVAYYDVAPTLAQLNRHSPFQVGYPGSLVTRPVLARVPLWLRVTAHPLQPANAVLGYVRSIWDAVTKGHGRALHSPLKHGERRTCRGLAHLTSMRWADFSAASIFLFCPHSSTPK
ncbi:hypothetical protein DFH06DRAFT_1292515 [Mycena polygramma]|nr:hypothetical protein DFH06DRAFT_1292515 [Mycena polygramma]